MTGVKPRLGRSTIYARQLILTLIASSDNLPATASEGHFLCMALSESMTAAPGRAQRGDGSWRPARL